MKPFLPVLMFLQSTALADVAMQTDWSGGPGIPGPVDGWGNEFEASSAVSWLAFAGEICLSSSPTPQIAHTVEGNFDGACSIHAADVDGDGDIDIIGAARDADDITWWENTDGSGSSWIMHTVEGNFDGARSVHAADLDGDGDTDILGAATDADDITWWENTDGSGTSWITHIVKEFYSGAFSVHASDVDGDGDVDVLGAAYTGDSITWWENTDGSGTSWIIHGVSGIFDGARAVYAADVDSDGDMDILGTAYFLDDITWWENTNGFGTNWLMRIVDGSFDGAFSVYAADIDSDGDMDILGAAADANDITWWENTNGFGTNWVKHIVDGSFGGAFSVHAADVDGDGDMDILGAAFMADDITWWENTDGSGTSWVMHTVVGHFSGASSIQASDVDGDGDMDILGAAVYIDDITWWEVSEFQGAGQLTSSILDSGVDPDWDQVTWTAILPSSTGFTVELRAGDDPGSMGAWQPIGSSGSDIPSSFDNMRCLQYRVTLSTSNCDVSPSLEDITVSWTPYLGVEGQEAGVGFYQLFEVYPNPSLGSVQIGFSIPASSRVDLSVFDVSGRIVSSTTMEYEEGLNSMQLGDLASGVYLVRMRAGEYEAAERFVVIE